MFKEFKEFLSRGNVVDMAIGVIIGGAFGKIIASLVNDILMPIIGLLMGGINFADLFVSLDGVRYEGLAMAEEAGGAVLKYGAFLQNVLDFIIIGFCIFIMVKLFNKTKRKKEEVPVNLTTKICRYCKIEIPVEAVKCPHCTSNLNE